MCKGNPRASAGLQKAHSSATCWAGRKVRGSAEERGDCEREFPERFEEDATWEQSPLLSWDLVGASGAIWTPVAVHPHISPFFTLLHPLRSVTGPSMWMSHGQGEVDPGSLLLRRIVSVFHLSLLFNSLLPPLPPEFNHSCLCCSLILSTLALSLSFWGISNTVWKLGNRQLPL